MCARKHGSRAAIPKIPLYREIVESGNVPRIYCVYVSDFCQSFAVATGSFSHVFFLSKEKWVGVFAGSLKHPEVAEGSSLPFFPVSRQEWLGKYLCSLVSGLASGFISLSLGAERPSFMCDLFRTWRVQSGAKIDLLPIGQLKWTINTWNVPIQGFLLFGWTEIWLISLKGFASRGHKITMHKFYSRNFALSFIKNALPVRKQNHSKVHTVINISKAKPRATCA